MSGIEASTGPSRDTAVVARLLLASAGGPEADDALRALLPRVADWKRVIELSVREGTHPALARRLRTLGAPLPAEVRAALAQLERAGEVRSAYMKRRLRDVVDRVAGAGIRVMLLKGAALAHATYASFSERPMSDLDLLVPAGDAPRAWTLCAESGWERKFDAEYDGMYEGMHHLPPLSDLRMPGMTVSLELHTAIIPRDCNPFAFTEADLWAGAVPAAGMPAGTFLPSPEHRLLHCCQHFAWSNQLAKGAWRALRDVAAIVREELVDWEAFAALATSSRGATCAYWTLRIAREFAAVPVPEAVLAALGAPWPEPISRRLARHLALQSVDEQASAPSVRLQRLLWEVAIRPGTSGHGARRPWQKDHLPWMLAKQSARGAATTADATSAAGISRWLDALASLTRAA